MSWIDAMKHRVRALFNPAAYERDLQDEMRFHLELDAMQQQDRDRARQRFGNRTYYAEETRRMTWLGSFDVLRQDLSYSWRSIRRTPGFTLMIVVTLALGLGVNAATFTLLDRLYLRAPDGVRDAGSLQRVWFWHSGERASDGKARFGSAANYPMYKAVVEASGAPHSVALYATDNALFLSREGRKTRVRGVFASASYFPVLGIRPALGRLYTAREDSLGGGSHVIVLSHRFWERELGGDSAILGKTLRIEADNYVVVGVLPAQFTGLDLQAADAWIPLAAIPKTHWMARAPRWWENGNPWGFDVLRRSSGPAIDRQFEQRATLAVREANRRLWQRYPDTLMKVHTDPLVRGTLGEPGQDMIISSRLGGVAVIVLVIACANVINLLLARAVRRRREIAVRLAMGISRVRLVRLLTTETVLLAVIAGGASLLVAWWGGAILRSLLLPQVTWYESALHWRVVVFAGVTSILAGIAAGIVPALQASNPDLTQALKEGTRDGAVHRSRLRQGLVIVQAAFSLTLLMGAALFVRSLNNVKGLDIGFDADRLVFGYLTFDHDQKVPAPVVAARMSELAERLRHRPGVEAVARSFMVPMRGFTHITFFWGADSSASLRENYPSVSPVSPEFFRAVGLRMVQGSTLESAPGTRQVVVNEAMAGQLWPNAQAIGQCIRFESRDSSCYTVVGVVENANEGYVIEKEKKPHFYLPLGNLPMRGYSGTTLVVRARGDAMQAAASELSVALRRAFPSGEVTVQPMINELEPEYRPWRLGASLFTAFGLLALLVAVIGIYSTVSYAVNQRTHEFGVRVALGARMGDVLRLVVGEGMRVVAIGVIVGVGLALAAGKLVAALLYGVAPYDPAVMLFASATLLVVAALAALAPAWRAARVDPVTALRAD
jgi:putative ABC transport system permease protein